MKKFMSLLMAIVMVFCLATPVGAINTEDDPNKNPHTITITNTASGYIYEAYQVFSGDLVSDKLTNITWGTGVEGDDLLAALKADEDLGAKFVKCTTAVDVAEVLSGLNAAEVEKFADLVAAHLTTTKATSAAPTESTVDGKKIYSYVISVTGDGYYFVKDQNGSVGEGEAYTKYILKVVQNLTVKSKSVAPTVDKQVWDEDGDQDLNAKVDEEGKKDNWGETADHDINEIFEFKLIATLPAEEDYDEYDSYKVVFTDTMSKGITFDDMVSVKINETVIENYSKSDITTDEETGEQTFTITIENVKSYDVNLTNGATIEVIYEAHLNEFAVIGNDDRNLNKVYLEYSNNPNTTPDDFGKTPEDTVWVFTYEVDVTKVDGKDNSVKLENAEFTLQNGDDEYVVIDSTTGKVKGWSTTKVLPTEGSTLTSVLISDANGLFKIIGLDHGTYTLTETKAPAGYNLLQDPIEIVLTATHREIDKNNAETYVIKMNEEQQTKVDPSIDLTVENNSGATLPETGGIGTTLFYVFGGLLFAGAAVLLITKKRMNEE